ncbi:MAG: tetratricopeptide repeat protein [Panacibacter sp.]
MRILLTVLHCFFISLLCFAQNNAIDSIDILIGKAPSDTVRINLLNKKIGILGNINLDTAISLGQKTLAEAIKINYKEGEGATRLKLASNYCFKGEYAAAEDNLKLAETIFKKLHDSLYIAKTYAGYGMMYGMQSKYDSAIQFYQNSIAIDERHGHMDEIARSYNNLAISYQMRSDFAQALQYQQKSLKIAESKNDEEMQARTLLNIGITYTTMGDTLRSEQNLLKAVELAKKKHIKIVELYAYSNLASLYETKNELQKSYAYAIKSAELGGEMGDQGIQSTGLSKAASSLAGQKKFDEAEKLSRRAVAIADSSNQPLNIYQSYNILGYIFKQQGRYNEAVPYYEKAFMALKDADIYDNQIGHSYLDLSECYEKTGNYSKALQTFKMASRITDSVTSKANVRKATELTMNYDFAKKQQAVAAEQAQKDTVAFAKQIALMVGLGLTLLIALVAFAGYRNKQKANALLQKQKEEINSALTKLKSAQAQLIQAEKMASLGELTAGIAHEIQNPLNFVNNFSEVNAELIDEMEEEIDKGNTSDIKSLAANIKQNLEKITHHGKRADAIVKNMLLHSRSSTGAKESVDINSLVDEYLRLSYHGIRAKDKTFNAVMETTYDKNVGKINVIHQDIGRVILNLINNAFYAVAEKSKLLGKDYAPTVSVSTKKIANQVEIQIRDNGMGIQQRIMDKVFQPFFTTKPTGEGTGLGLSLSYDIITKGHNGEMKVETKEGEFATFIILLPL